MKKFVLILFVLICLLALPALAEPDHSMIKVSDETIYVYLPTKYYSAYTAHYNCLLTNTDSNKYYLGKIKVNLLDRSGRVVCELNPEGYFVLKPGETEATFAICHNVSSEQREQIASYELVWDECYEITQDHYYEVALIDLPIDNLKSENVNDGVLYTCTITNPLDIAINIEGIYGQLEYYDPTNGHLVFCRYYYDSEFKDSLKGAGLLPGYSLDNWKGYAVPDGLIEIIGTNYNLKLHVTCQYHNSWLVDYFAKEIDHYIGTKK